jgi:hypothetical protein
MGRERKKRKKIIPAVKAVTTGDKGASNTTTTKLKQIQLYYCCFKE